MDITPEISSTIKRIRQKYFPDSDFIGPYEREGYPGPIYEEQWIWQNRDKIKGVVLDMSTPRYWHEYLYHLDGVSNIIISEYGSDTVSKYGQTSKADIVADFCSTPPPLPPNSVDTILCLSILEHCEDMFAMVRNLYTILKPNGYVFFWTPYAYIDGHLIPDYWRIGRDGYRLLAKKSGFEIISEQRFGDLGKYLVEHCGIDASANEYHRGIPVAFAVICRKNAMNDNYVECPLCNGRCKEFHPYGATLRPNALCPQCGSLERHRLLWLFLKRKTNFSTDKLKVLDIAPTKGLSDAMMAMPNIEYISIDKYSSLAMRNMDITALDFPNDSFDSVICYHVLEHIPDDRKALQEIFRVLKPGGWAILQVPVDERLEQTVEGAHIDDPQMRKQLFGQEDHVRTYGRDYSDRLRHAGFEVEINAFGETVSIDEINKYRLFSNEKIYICKKDAMQNTRMIHDEGISLKDNYICHLVYEHDFIQYYNDMIVQHFDIEEHVFIVYASLAWDASKKYNLRNSYYINNFDDSKFLDYADRSSQIIVHTLYTPALTNFLFQHQYLLSKVNWKLWGGDLYLYRLAGTSSNPSDNEDKRKVIINKLGYITSPVREEYEHAVKVYGGNAEYHRGYYPPYIDYQNLKPKGKSPHDSPINIVVGNSAYQTNNHIEAFSSLLKFKDENIKIYCPLSYGDNNYAKEVCKSGEQLFGDKFVPMLNLIPYEEYVDFLSTMDIGVMNHNRQQGSGNIVLLLYLGKKVYMQPDITSYHCFRRLGFDIFNVEDISKFDLYKLVQLNTMSRNKNTELIIKYFSMQGCIHAWKAIFTMALQKPVNNGMPVHGERSTSGGISRSAAGKSNNLRKILFVNHNIPPYELSGTPITTLNHAIGMNNRGLISAVLVPNRDVSSGFELSESSGVTVYKIPCLDKYKAYLNDFPSDSLSQYSSIIDKVLSDFKPDIVHINDYVYMPVSIIEQFHRSGALVVRNICNYEEFCHFDYPVIPDGLQGRLCSGPESAEKCAHCFVQHRLHSNDAGAVERITGLISAKRSYLHHVYNDLVDGVIFTENAFRRNMKRFLSIPDDKITIIPRGIENKFAGSERPDHQKGQKVRFAFVGNIMFSKGIDIVLKAFAMLSSINEFSLTMYGQIVDGEYSPEIERLRNLYPDKLIFNGPYKKEDITGIAQNSDVCIVPSYFDTYNRVVREMLSVGVPLIVTDFFGASIIKDGVNGLKIPVGNANALAAAMKRLIDNNDLLITLSRGVTDTKIPSLNEEIVAIVSFHERLLKKQNVRLIAFYLPQYHPIPENDAWWGTGFTEWTNVKKAGPLFPGHYQPHVPADLGYYDLRDSGTREAQAELARKHGLHGFCYYHYWFNGKRLLNLPFDEVLSSGKPDFPFCLCWANEPWTRSWDGFSGEVLIDQQSSEKDDINHIHWLKQAFLDKRYIRIKGKPLFMVYRARKLPDPLRTTTVWRNEARKLGIGELYLCRVESFPDEHDDPQALGFDAAVEFQPDWTHLGLQLKDPGYGDNRVYRYADIVDRMLQKPVPPYKRFPCVSPSWDNAPRRRHDATILLDSNPDLYEKWLTETVRTTPARGLDDAVVFINAWNEWGEGNHLEPDEKFGMTFLEATQRALSDGVQSSSTTLTQQCYAHAVSLMQTGKTTEAINTLESLVRSRPDHALAHNDLGVLYYGAGNREKAFEHYAKAVQLDPENLTAAKNLADFTYIALGRIEDAMRMYTKILQRQPNDVETLLALGQVNIQSGDLARAVELFQHATAIEPDNAPAREVLTILLQGANATPAVAHHSESNNSVGRNLAQWSSYEWPEGGDEWSSSWGGTENLWSGTIYPRIKEYLPAGHILEIAPGYGRCTQYLVTQCERLTVVDLAQNCIDACKKRFAERRNISYFVNDGKSLAMLDDNSLDFAFSWDSLVHAESDVLEAYVKQLAVKLKPGGFGFLHHSTMGDHRDPVTGKLNVENKHWRGESMTAGLFRQYCDDAGLTCISQELIAWGGSVLNDCFSLFTRGQRPSGEKCVIIENVNFMQEARRMRDFSSQQSSAAQTNRSVSDRVILPTERVDSATSDDAVSSAKQVDIDWTSTFDYNKLTREELDEYSNIEITKDLREGGIHAHKAWEYWFRYLSQHLWKSSLGKEILTFCNEITDPAILSLGCGYGGIELEVAGSLHKPYTIIAVDINEHIFSKARQEASKKGLNIRFLPLDLNFIEIRDNYFDLIFAHASLHHLLNLEQVFHQIYKGLKQHGRLIVQDIIGKTQVLFWKENVDFARGIVKKMPSRYTSGISRQDLIIPPYVEPAVQKGMEGIRQEEIETQLDHYFAPVKMFKYGSFVRMICTHPELGKRIDPDKKSDREYLEGIFRLDLQQIEKKKLRPTEMLAVYDKKPSIDMNKIAAEAHTRLGSEYLQQGDTERATLHFRRALASDPNDQLALRHLDALAKGTSVADQTITSCAGQPETGVSPAPAYGSRPSVSILIPWSDSTADMQLCMDHLLRNTEYENVRFIVVVDNAPDNFSSTVRRDRWETFITNNAAGIVSGCKSAADQSSADYLVFLDPRIRVSRGWLNRLLGTSLARAVPCAMTPKVITADFIIHEAGYSYGDKQQMKVIGNGEGSTFDAPAYNYVAELSGGSRYCMLIPKTAWIEAGGFDAHIADLGLALMDLGLSLRRRGVTLLYQPHSIVMLSCLRADTQTGNTSLAPGQEVLDRLRPVVLSQIADRDAKPPSPRKQILVLGIYLAAKYNNVADIAATLSSSKIFDVTQQWVALGGQPPSPEVAKVTVRTILDKGSKYQIMNDLLAREDLSRFEYILMVDDDVVLTARFIDDFITLQSRLDFALAQPARTSNSSINHPIVERHNGLLARQTRFVEIGPVVSFHKTIFNLIFPFDLTSSMGWGYENIWASMMTERDLKMGIIDHVPVDHSIRKPVEHYDWSEADRERNNVLKKHKSLPLEECFSVLQAFTAEGVQ